MTARLKIDSTYVELNLHGMNDHVISILWWTFTIYYYQNDMANINFTWLELILQENFM